jgi:hypothetical protein
VTTPPSEAPLLERGKEYLLFLKQGEDEGKKDVFWITFGYLGLAEVKDETIHFQNNRGINEIRDLEGLRISDMPERVQQIKAETAKDSEGFGWDGIIVNKSAEVSELAKQR